MNYNLIKKKFPISSQTSNSDKKVIINIINLIKKNKKKKFNYLEIGSFLGGSLTPFLMENKCKFIMSIDKRNQKQNDERSEEWSYENVSEQDMLNKLKQYNLNVNKLKTFNGDIKDFKTTTKFDLAFIDGIHTDINTFSDFLHTLKKINKDSIILFHDSSIIYKSINMVNLLLVNSAFNFKLAKFKGSEITGIFFGKFSKLNLSKTIMPIQNFSKFSEMAGENLLLEQINNRIKINFKISKFLKRKYPYKLSLNKKEKKTSLDFHK